MKKIKYLIVVLMICFLTGCNVKNNYVINKDLSISEEIIMSETREYFNKSYKMLPINKVKELLHSNDNEKILQDNGYQYKIDQSDVLPKVIATKKYNTLQEFSENNFAAKQIFTDVIVTEKDNLITIDTSGFIKPDPYDQDRYYVDNCEISIKLPYVVTENNADKYKASTNTYTWIINEKTKDKEIKITFDKTRIYIYNLVLYISIGIVILLILIGIFIILKLRRKNIKMNRL